MRSRTGFAPQQPEKLLFNDTPYKLPEPESTDLVPAGEHALASPSSPQLQQQAESRSPREWLLFVVWRQKFLILGVVVLSLLAGLVYQNVKTPIYTSTARVYVQPTGLSLAVNGQGGYGQTGGGNFLYTQRELITSEPVLAIAAGKLKAIEEQRKQQGVKQWEIRTLKGVEKPAAYLKEIVLTELDKNNDIISITAHSPHSDEAALIANEVKNAYNAYQFKPRVNTTGDTVQVLEKKKAEAEAELKTKVDAIAAMEAQYGPLNAQNQQTNIVLQRLKGLSEALLAAQQETITARSAYEELKRTMGVTDDNLKLAPSEMDSDLLLSSEQDQAMLRSLILQAQSQLEALRQHYLPNHPAIAKMKQQLAQYNLAYLASIQRRYVAAQRREADHQAAFNEGQKAAVLVDAKSAEYGRALEDIDRLKKLRDGYDANIKTIQLDNDAGKVKVEEVEAAQAKAKPSIPDIKRTLPISLALGLVAGLLLACMREWIDDRFRSAGEIKSSLGMPLLAVIPQSATKRSLSVSGTRILLDPSSDAAEAYRSLRTAIQFATPSGDMKTLLITSPSSGDGKTTLVSNLAIAMAQSGKKVIVVDADLRKPMQHEIFGAKNNTGLSMLLAGRCSLDTAVQRTGVSGLDILPCGPAPANPTEILNSREFGDTLEQLAEKYDCVVIDSSPVESVNDARIIAASCDATLIVLKAQTAHRRQAERARDSLLGVGARIIGLVVNDLPRRTQAAYGQFAQTRRYVPGLTSQEYDILQAQSK